MFNNRTLISRRTHYQIGLGNSQGEGISILIAYTANGIRNTEQSIFRCTHLYRVDSMGLPPYKVHLAGVCRTRFDEVLVIVSYVDKG